MLDQVYPILTQTAQRLLHLAIAAKPPVVAGVAVGDADGVVCGVGLAKVELGGQGPGFAILVANPIFRPMAPPARWVRVPTFRQ
jgi:hypothetical protein